MIFANELVAVTAEETQLEQLLQALRQKKSFFQQIQGKAQEHLQGLSWVVGHAKENLGTDALASLKTAVLTLFTDGDGGNDDGGNEPTDPTSDTDPTPGEPVAVDANGGLAESCEWASEFASHLTCLVWEDAPLLGQHCSVSLKQNENKDTSSEGEDMPKPPSTEMVHLSAQCGYLKLQCNGQILSAYCWFAKKAIAQSWLKFLEPY